MEHDISLIKLMTRMLAFIFIIVNLVFAQLLFLFTNNVWVLFFSNIIVGSVLGYLTGSLENYLVYDNNFLIYLKRTASIYKNINEELNRNPSPFMFHWIYEKFNSNYDKKLLYNELRKVHNSSTIRIIPRNTDVTEPYVFLDISLDDLFSSPSKYIKYYESANQKLQKPNN